MRTTSLFMLPALTLACADLTVPRQDVAPTVEAKPTATASAAPAPEASPRRVRMEQDDRISASHVLIAFKGALRAKDSVTRSKQEALDRAKEVLKQAKAGKDFAALAKEFSDGPSAPKGGSLGSFDRKSMVKPFSDAAFALKPGEVSEPVETSFGFHVIKRDQ